MEKYIKVSILFAIVAIAIGYAVTPYLTNPILDNYYKEYNSSQILPTNTLFVINGKIEPNNLPYINNQFVFIAFLKDKTGIIVRNPNNYGRFGENLINMSGTCAKVGNSIKALAQPYNYYDGTEIRLIKVLEGC